MYPTLVVAGLILSLGAYPSAVAQTSNKNIAGPAALCDFSNLKPLSISHALLAAVVERVQPEYPKAARAVNASGSVDVRIIVDRNGKVVEACALNGHVLLRPAAIDAARQWKFKQNFGFTNRPRVKYIQSHINFNFLPRE